jgi:diguanylate cyclase
VPKIDYSIGERALAFLNRQCLAPTPQNYALAYIALADPQSPIGKAVNEITCDGVRIRQDEADEIICAQAGGFPGLAPAGGDGDDRDALRHQTIKLSEVASSAAAATGAFARELSFEAQALDGAGSRTVQIVAQMIERSKSTEIDLNAAANEVAALRQELEAARDDAQRDQLTGLGNRRAIDRYLQRLAKEGNSYVVGICDADHFKTINDRHGHGVGDRVLKQIASSLANTCAPHFFGRWGGEEFLLIMEGADTTAAVALLDRARADLESRAFKLRETDEPVGKITFSAGVALATTGRADATCAIHRADAALYRAKAAGRNQVLAE